MDWQSPHVAQGPDGLISPALLYTWTSLSALHHFFNHALVSALREEKFTMFESMR